MRTLTSWTAVLLCIGALSAVAQDPAASPAKVGVISFQAAVTQTNEFQRDFADLQKKYEPKRQELKTLSDQIETLKKQLQTQGDTLSDTERESRTRAINEKGKQLQRTQEDDQNNFSQDMQQTFNAVATKVGDLLIDYAQKQGYTVVLDGGSQDAQVVLYASTSTDLTKIIIDAYNAKSGVPAQPGQPAATAPKPAARPAAPHPAQH
ncbi:MAG: OmpH family outer membrane protein [Terracidiphilus sp.]|nr:OmpH family outer membrane protein [Terracidiphilus sp.]